MRDRGEETAYFRIDHNTLNDSAQYGKFLTVLGDVHGVSVTNNLMVDHNEQWKGTGCGGIYVAAADLPAVYNAAAALLSWDQTSYMPEGGAPARGRQLALLSRLGHEKFTDPEIGRLLDALQPYGESLPFDDDDAALGTRGNHAYILRSEPWRPVLCEGLRGT